MALILGIETSTHNCSVCLAEGKEILALVERSSDEYIHSEKLHLFIRQVLSEAGKSVNDLDTVAVGKGPGSYTGLRIGVSAAKGFCFALNIPLVSLDGIQILGDEFCRTHSLSTDDVVIPMIDARRMEVYCALHDSGGKRIAPIEAKIIDENSFGEIEAEHIHLIGDGAEKCREVLSAERFIFHDLKYPSARALVPGALKKFLAGDVEDVAYFEPFYLKDFIAGKPRKLL